MRRFLYGSKKALILRVWLEMKSMKSTLVVAPAKAGVQGHISRHLKGCRVIRYSMIRVGCSPCLWIPAFAGRTKGVNPLERLNSFQVSL